MVTRHTVVHPCLALTLLRFAAVVVFLYCACSRHQFLALENSYETVALLSLAGVNCVLSNQWYTSLCANSRMLQGLLSSLRKDKNVGQAVHTVSFLCCISKWKKRREDLRYASHESPTTTSIPRVALTYAAVHGRLPCRSSPSCRSCEAMRPLQLHSKMGRARAPRSHSDR